MWEGLKKACLHSLTIAWSYLLAFVGLLLSTIDNIGDIVGDPNLKQQISSVVTDTKTLSQIFLAISVINIIARMRSLRKGP